MKKNVALPLITKGILALLLTFSLIFLQTTSILAQAAIVDEKSVSEQTSVIGNVKQVSERSPVEGVAEYQQFLQDKYGITLQDALTKGGLIEAVSTLLQGQSVASTEEETAITF
ncbi:hypothetical protein [Bacillus horti]|uniref:Uncharacterized protein n=1 Tax=Caldalkalibacillus horti TaxID=77523 RepID=A0ABT9VV64_9BACI|nr:hypothetical protein [Bacillus horti]MDQ0164875.1 hypothetical protein [Bacillus horti]